MQPWPVVHYHSIRTVRSNFNQAAISSQAPFIMSNVPIDQIDAVFRLMSREIWIVTAAAGEDRGGLAATWVSPASIDRENPLAVIALAPNHYTCELVERSGCFAAHLIRPDQIDLVWRFGLGSGRVTDKLSGITTHSGETGSPVLSDCLGRFEGRVVDRHDTGDRVYFWAEVVAGEKLGEGRALCEQALIAAASPEQLGSLRTQMGEDVQIQRPLCSEWLERASSLLKK